MKNVITKGLAVKLVSGVAALALVAGVGTACYFGLKQDQNNSNVQPADVVVSSQPDDAKQEEAEATEPSETTEDLITESEEEFVPLDPGEAWYAEEEVKQASGFLENGDFTDGMDYWETYSYLEGNIEYSADAENGFEISIANTGTEDWHVQLKQNGISLTKGKWYKVTLDAKSSMDRSIIFTMQRDGMADDNWTAYSPATRLALTKSWQTYSIIFQMTEPSDSKSIFNFAMGKVDGVKIAKQHTVGIRNIKMQTLSDDWMDSIGEEGNLIKNGSFEYKDLLWEPSVVSPGMAKYTFDNNKVVFDITNPGTVDWHVQLKQGGIPLEKGMGYRLTFNANSTVARTIKIGFMDKNYVNWYGGADLALNAGDNKAVVEFMMEMDNNDDVLLMVSMGKIEGGNTPACGITMSDFKLEKVPGLVVSIPNSDSYGGNPFTLLPDGWAVYDHEDTHSPYSYEDGVNGFKIGITDTGTEDWHVQLQKKNVALTKGKWYRISFDAMSTSSRTIGYMIQRDGANDNDWTPYSATDGSDKPVIDGAWKTITQDFQMNATSDNNAIFNFSLGSVNGVHITEPHTVWIRNIVLQQIAEPEPEKIKVNTEMLKNTSFTGDSNWNVNKTNGTTIAFNGNSAVFNITNPGVNDYDVQLTQTGLSFEKGCKYRFTLDASSDVPRTIKVAALVNGTYDYLGGMDIVLPGASAPVAVAESTGSDGEFVFEFVMEKESTVNGMIAVSMGRIDGDTPSNSVVTISNVSLMKTAEAIKKPVTLEDGTIVVSSDCTQEEGKWVVKLDDKDYNLNQYVGKKLKISADLYSEGAYSAMFGSCFTSDKDEWDWTDTGVIEVEADTNKAFELTVDNYRGALQIQIYKIEEGSDVKIKNLKFEEIVEETPEEPEKPEEGVIIVKSTDEKVTDEYGSKWVVEFGNDAYDLNQYVGKNLKIKMDLYSEGAFSAMLGACYSDEWAWKGADTIEVAADTTQKFELVVEDFKGAAQIQIYYIEEGASVEISNISFEEVVEETPEEPEQPTPGENAENLFANASFDNNGAGWEVYIHDTDKGGSAVANVTFENKAAVYDIQNTGDAEWNIQLKQVLKLQGDSKYKLTFDVTSTADRSIKVGSMDANNVIWYGGADNVMLVANEEKKVEVNLDLTGKATDETAYVSIQMGKGDVVSKITIKNVVLVKVTDDNKQPEQPEQPEEPEQPTPGEDAENLFANASFDNNGAGWEVYIHDTDKGGSAVANVTFENKAAVYDIQNTGDAEWNIQLKQVLKLQGDSKYKLTFDVTSTADRSIKVGSMDANNVIWYGGADDVRLVANEEKKVEVDLDLTGKATDETAYVSIQMGKGDVVSKITIKNVVLVKEADNN